MRMRIMRRMDTPRDHVLALEKRLKAERVSLGEVLTEARIDRSTWTRWKAGTYEPKMKSWMRVKTAAEKRLAVAL